MKIAVKLSDSSIITDVNNTSEDGAIRQSKIKGWTLVESDPAFLISEKYLWTVRESDNKLVHVSSQLTPDEENQKSQTELTSMLMAQGQDIESIKQSITELTNLQLQSTTGGN